VTQLRRDADFAEEPLATQGLRHLRPQDLEGHLTAMLEILGLEYQAHATVA